VPDPVGFRTLIQFERGLEVRTYSLRAAPSGAELWRITDSPGEPTKFLKEADVANIDETFELLEEIERSLRAAGWTEAANDPT
jgi:hypothetical protein